MNLVLQQVKKGKNMKRRRKILLSILLTSIIPITLITLLLMGVFEEKSPYLVEMTQTITVKKAPNRFYMEESIERKYKTLDTITRQRNRVECKDGTCIVQSYDYKNGKWVTKQIRKIPTKKPQKSKTI